MRRIYVPLEINKFFMIILLSNNSRKYIAIYPNRRWVISKRDYL